MSKDQSECVAQEILDTEESYVSMLKVFQHVLVQGLLRASRSDAMIWSLLDEPAVAALISAMDDIQSISEALLLALRQRIAQHDKALWANQVAQVFMEFGSLFRLYWMFAREFERASDVFSKHIAAHKPLSDLVKDLQRDERVKSQILSSFLILPIQRLPRYVLLLKVLIKQTKSVGRLQDAELLDVVISEIQEVAAFINKSVEGRLSMIGDGGEVAPEILAQAMKDISELRLMLESSSPVWESDSSSDHCTICESQFNPFWRRNNARNVQTQDRWKMPKLFSSTSSSCNSVFRIDDQSRHVAQILELTSEQDCED